MIYFNLFSMRLLSSHDAGHEFDELTQVDSSCFCVFFVIDFSISITSFNIRFIEN